MCVLICVCIHRTAAYYFNKQNVHPLCEGLEWGWGKVGFLSSSESIENNSCMDNYKTM